MGSTQIQVVESRSGQGLSIGPFAPATALTAVEDGDWLIAWITCATKTDFVLVSNDGYTGGTLVRSNTGSASTDRLAQFWYKSIGQDQAAFENLTPSWSPDVTPSGNANWTVELIRVAGLHSDGVRFDNESGTEPSYGQGLLVQNAALEASATSFSITSDLSGFLPPATINPLVDKGRVLFVSGFQVNRQDTTFTSEQLLNHATQALLATETEVLDIGQGTGSGGTRAALSYAIYSIDLNSVSVFDQKASFGVDVGCSGALVFGRVNRARWLNENNQPGASGSLSVRLNAKRSVTGNQLAPSGILSKVRVFFRSVAGAQLAATGILTKIRTRLTTGNQPSGSGSVSRKLQALRSVAGSQDSASSTLARAWNMFRTLAGSQDAASATVASVKLQQIRALAGTQPAATATLARKLSAFRTLTGDQAASSAILTRLYATYRTLAGEQPSATATLKSSGQFSRTISGNQAPANGGLLRSAVFSSWLQILTRRRGKP